MHGKGDLDAGDLEKRLRESDRYNSGFIKPPDAMRGR